jgi:hypothetical protein
VIDENMGTDKNNREDVKNIVPFGWLWMAFSLAWVACMEREERGEWSRWIRKGMVAAHEDRLIDLERAIRGLHKVKDERD